MPPFVWCSFCLSLRLRLLFVLLLIVILRLIFLLLRLPFDIFPVSSSLLFFHWLLYFSLSNINDPNIQPHYRSRRARLWTLRYKNGRIYKNVRSLQEAASLYRADHVSVTPPCHIIHQIILRFQEGNCCTWPNNMTSRLVAFLHHCINKTILNNFFVVSVFIQLKSIDTCPVQLSYF